MNILDLYYGLWAQMLPWPVIKRASLMIGIACLIFYIALMPVLTRILSLIFYLFNGIVKGAYCSFIEIAECGMKNRNQMERATILNQISGGAEKISEKITSCSDRIKNKKRISFLKMVLIYMILLLLIGLPDFLGNKIEVRYLSTVSFASHLYQKLEERVLAKAAQYPPLFRENAVEAISQTETEQASEESHELWLSLSSKGRDGANMRETASASSKRIKVLSGEDQVLYLGREENWVHIRLATGEEGFISANLLKDVPEE